MKIKIRKLFYKGVKIYSVRSFYFFNMNGTEHGFQTLREATNYIDERW